MRLVIVETIHLHLQASKVLNITDNAEISRGYYEIMRWLCIRCKLNVRIYANFRFSHGKQDEQRLSGCGWWCIWKDSVLIAIIKLSYQFHLTHKMSAPNKRVSAFLRHSLHISLGVCWLSAQQICEHPRKKLNFIKSCI